MHPATAETSVAYTQILLHGIRQNGRFLWKPCHIEAGQQVRGGKHFPPVGPPAPLGQQSDDRFGRNPLLPERRNACVAMTFGKATPLKADHQRHMGKLRQLKPKRLIQ